jgi:hypothetical protein
VQLGQARLFIVAGHDDRKGEAAHPLCPSFTTR